MSRHKAFPIASFKAVDGAPAGTFEALVSVFGNVDLGGDRVVKGAFAKSLADWASSGDPVPVIWSHDWANPDAHIGYANAADIVETDAGLLVKGQLDVEKPFARQVFDLLASRRVKESSFAYDIVHEAKAADGANELTELTLIEVGPTLKGMNPATELGTVKARGSKAQVSLDGSVEQRQAALADAVRTWAVGYRHDDVYCANVEATFDDHVIAYVEAWDEPWGGGTYYQLPYTAGEAGIELGEATPVDIVGTVRPKAGAGHHLKRAAKEGRRNSTADADQIQQLHDIVTSLSAVCAAADGTTADTGGQASAPAGAAKTGLALAELDLLEFDVA